MPFPWKKNRVTRISQIVADLQSPKHGGSLVVETGFPTSLIDLFVKNRSRFKKSKSKKPVRPEIPVPPPPPPSPATTPPPVPDPPSTIFPRAEAPRLSPLVAENGAAVAVSGRVGECGAGSDANMVVGVFVKMFVVVVLIASVKRLTVGITVSAFALVFLEYAGKRVVSHLGPCSNANLAMESLFKRVSSSTCVWFQKLLQLKAKKHCELAIVQGEILVGAAELGSGSLSIGEIEVVETKSEVGICCEETCFLGPELDSLSGDMKWGGPELVEDDYSMGIKVVEPCGISECKKRGSRSGRFKSKMVKKLVPKKFRCSKKEKKEKGSKEEEVESGSEVSSAVDEDKLPSFEIEEEPEDVAKEEEENRNRTQLLLKTNLECVRDDELDCGITCSQESPLAKEEVAVSGEEKRIDRVGNSGYTILFIIALSGLVVGRFPALILTMTWCFMLKIVKTLWRSQNVPLIKCSVPNS